MSAANLTEVVQRFTARYRAGLLRKAGLLAALGACILGLVGWRLHQLRLGAVWSAGVPGGLGLAAAGGLVWWLRRNWISRRGGVTYLDRALGLQQRLITAEEFASATPPPALYPLLVEDASRRCTVVGARFPRPVDRTTAALAALLVLLLLWPVRGHVPLQQLAQLPQALLPPHPPDTKPSPDPDRQDQRMDRSQQGGSSTQQAPQPQSGGGRESSHTSERGQSSRSQDASAAGESSPQTGEQSQQAGGEGQEQPADRGGADEHQAGQAGQDGSREPDADSNRAGQDEEQEGQSGAQADASGQRGRSQSSPHQEGRDGQQADGGEGEQGSSRQGRAQAGAGPQQGSGGDAPSATASLQQQAAAGGGQSPGDQAALKAEIQELLKEVSGELKHLQAQLAVAHPETGSAPGTSTDPELYEAPMPIGPDATSALPMALGTDTAQTKTPRPGGGVGEASEKVASEAPREPIEDAQLSEVPLEERAVGRHVIPPEYRDVFERLNRGRTTPETDP